MPADEKVGSAQPQAGRVDAAHTAKLGGTVDATELFDRWQRDRDPREREQLVARFLPLARKLALRYGGGHEPLEDRIQVARIGLLKAIDRFDPGRGTAFTSYAVPTMLEELKRYFRKSVGRDNGDSISGPRLVVREVLLPVLEHQPVRSSWICPRSHSWSQPGARSRRHTPAAQHPEPPVRDRMPRGWQVHRILALLGLLDPLAVFRSRESAVIGGDDALLQDGQERPAARCASAEPEAAFHHAGKRPVPQAW